MAEDEAEEDAGGMIDVAAAEKPAAGKAADAADIIDVAAASKPAAEEVTSPHHSAYPKCGFKSCRVSRVNLQKNEGPLA
jgi:hypothetical protein